MFVIIYGFGLLFFWVKAARMQAENFPQLDEDTFLNWKGKLRRSHRKYAALFILQIILAFIVGLVGSTVSNQHENFDLANTPIYFQILVWVQFIYMITIACFTAYNAYKNYQYGKQIGIY
ncbi:hypothetical protein OAO18_01285 [Francisellaceae bacterium]|nr:hypothetical protein [Francisellaceae bacterium]